MVIAMDGEAALKLAGEFVRFEHLGVRLEPLEDRGAQWEVGVLVGDDADKRQRADRILEQHQELQSEIVGDWLCIRG